MRQKNFYRFSRLKILLERRGQVALLWALLIPILFLCLGLGLDLGWYYLNVSRLQNAADSAAVAGAQKILENKEDTELSDYKSVKLVSQYNPDNPYTTLDNKLMETIGYSHDEAASYVRKNLASSKDSFKSYGDGNYTMIDGWSQKNNSKVTMNSSMYQYKDNVYFVVKLNEDIRHFLMPDWFADMSAPVTAVAVLSKGMNIIEEITEEERILESPLEIVSNQSGGDDNSSTSGGSSSSAKHKTPPSVNSSDSALDELTNPLDNLIEKIFSKASTVVASNSINQNNSDENSSPPENYNPTPSGTSTIGGGSTSNPSGSSSSDSSGNSNTQQTSPPDKTTKITPSDKSTVAGISISDSGNSDSKKDSSSSSDTQQTPPLPDNATTPTKPTNSSVGGVTTATNETRNPNAIDGSNGSNNSNVQPSAPPSSGNNLVAISPTNPNGSTVLPPSQNTNSVTPFKLDNDNPSTDSPQTPPSVPDTVTPILPQSGTTTTTPATAINPYPSVIPPVSTPPAVNTITPYIPIEITTPTPTVTPTPISSDITETPTKPDSLPTPVKPEEKLQLIFDTNVSQFGAKNRKYLKKINSVETLKKNNQKVTVQISETLSLANHEFIGWNTKSDGSGKYIADGEKLTPAQVATLFDSKTSVTLYAQWDNIINNKTLWQQMEYVKAKHAYDPDWYTSRNKYGPLLNMIDVSLENAVRKTATIGTETRVDTVYKAIETADRLFVDFKPQTLSDTVTATEHALINVNSTYDVRDGKNDDPLYIRIESEPRVWSSSYWSGNKPQQIIININVSNLADNKRPLFFYYDGPLENREPVPVILNLNADFKGVLYMPDIPVVINGNEKKFEGFIIAKEYRKLDEYIEAIDGVNKVTHRVTANGNTYTTVYKVDGSLLNVQSTEVSGTASALGHVRNSAFGLSSASAFKKFKIETDLEFMYVQYDSSGVMIPLTERDGETLIPLYDSNGELVTDWDDVKLYDKPATDSTRIERDKTTTDKTLFGIPLLDSDGKPVPLYDEYGNKIYFCDDYGRLGIQYDILTLQKYDAGEHQPYEFLFTKDDLDESNTDDWT